MNLLTISINFAAPFDNVFVTLHPLCVKDDEMKLKEVVELLNAKVVSGEALLNAEVEYVFASDLMSDVLTIETDNLLLITGLANLQTIRTAEMSDISKIIFARKKKATDEMIRLAAENDMILIECDYSMFKTSGILFQSGLKPVY